MTIIDFDEHYYIIKELEFNDTLDYAIPMNSHIFPIITEEDFKHSFKNNVNIYTIVNTKNIKKKYCSTIVLSTTKINKRKKKLYKLNKNK